MKQLHDLGELEKLKWNDEDSTGSNFLSKSECFFCISIQNWLKKPKTLCCIFEANQELLPFDHDLDIAIIGKEDVSKFYLLQNFQQYHHLIENRLYDIQLNVYSVYRDYDSHNSVDGRIIDKSNGLYIDIFLYLKYGDNYLHKCWGKINEYPGPSFRFLSKTWKKNGPSVKFVSIWLIWHFKWREQADL